MWTNFNFYAKKNIIWFWNLNNGTKITPKEIQLSKINLFKRKTN